MSPAPTRFPVAGDVIALTLVDDVVNVLLVERKYEPFAGRLAFPGGFVDPGEDLAAAALRELREETGVAVQPELFVQLGAYGVGNRDPRGDTVSVVFIAIAEDFGDIVAGDDAAAAHWVALDAALEPGALAFDHGMIFRDALARCADFSAPRTTVHRVSAYVQRVAQRSFAVMAAASAHSNSRVDK